MKLKYSLFNLVLMLALYSQVSNASTTTVTATVTSGDGQVYNSGTVTATFVPDPNRPTENYISGGVTFSKVVNGTLNTSGTFSVVLTTNNTIEPANSKWDFTVCSKTSAPCVIYRTSVTGPVDLSAQITAIAPAISVFAGSNPGYAGTAYTDAEISHPSFGTFYYNTVSNFFRSYNGSVWSNVGSNAFNIKSFGATGDCVTNDSVSIQNAINAAQTVGGIIYGPTGCYVADGLVGTSNLYGVVGDAPHLTKFVAPAGSVVPIFTDTVAPDTFKMNDITFIGPGQSAASGQKAVVVGFSGGNLSDCTFLRLDFQSWPNYGLDLEAPIVCRVQNVRVLQSMKGILYNGGTSITTEACYMNNVLKVGYDMVGTDYSSFISNAADTTGLAYLLRNNSIGVTFLGNGHEVGTARNVSVTNVALTANVATVTYTGEDLSPDFTSGMSVFINGTATLAGIFNGRVEPTSVTSSTITYSFVRADVPSTPDSGTICLFCGDGIVANNAQGTQILAFHGTSAQQVYSNHVTLSGTTSSTLLSGIISNVGTSGATPVAQDHDLYYGPNTTGIVRILTAITAITNLANNVQTLSGNTWTLGTLTHNGGVPAVTGYLRLNKTDTVCFRNNANSADVCWSLNASDQMVASSAIVSPNFISSSANPATSGQVRLGNGDTIQARNGANTGDLIVMAFDGNDRVLMPREFYLTNVPFIRLNETGSTPALSSNQDVCYPDSTLHAIKCSYNNGALMALPQQETASDAAVDLALVATGACTAERTVAVTNAAFGNSVVVSGGTALEAGTFLVGKVSSAGNTKWQFCNLSGGNVDRASDTYTIRVIH